VELHLEVNAGGEWVSVGSLIAGDPAGSLSDRYRGRCGMYVFVVDDGGATIWYAKAGAAAEEETAQLVAANGWELMSALRPGDTYEVDVQPDMQVAYHARWRLEEVRR
jgi:hypothetical protein